MNPVLRVAVRQGGLRRGVRHNTAKVGSHYVEEPAEYPLGSQRQSFRGQHQLPVATEGRVISLEDSEVRARAVERDSPAADMARTRQDLDPSFWFPKRDFELGKRPEAVVQPHVPYHILEKTEDIGDLRRVLEGDLVVPDTWEEIGLEGEFAEVAREWIGPQPSTVQKDIVPALLHIKDRDIVYSAVTGTGKTVAYLMSLLQLISQEKRGITVIMVPSKQLALQLYAYCLKWTNKGELLGRTDSEWLQLHLQDPNEDVDKTHADYRRLKRKWYGGARLVITQPPRWADYLLAFQMTLPIRRIVIDEALTCFNPIDPLTAPQAERLERTRNPNPTDIVMSYYLAFPAYNTHMRAQVVMLTATYTELLQNHTLRYLKPNSWTHLTTRRKMPFTVRHKFIHCGDGDAVSAFLLSAQQIKPKRAVVFIDNHDDLQQTYEHMIEAGLNVRMFDVSDGTVPAFQDKSWQYLLLKESVAYGLDLPDVSHVFVLHCPTSKDAYCHMAGRTGRFGAWGDVVNIVEPGALKEWHAQMHLLDIKMHEKSEDLHGNSLETDIGSKLMLISHNSDDETLKKRETAVAKRVEKRRQILYTLARAEGESWVKANPSGSLASIMASINDVTSPPAPMSDEEVREWYRKSRTEFLRKSSSLSGTDFIDTHIDHLKAMKYNWLERREMKRLLGLLPNKKKNHYNRAVSKFAKRHGSREQTVKGWLDSRLLHRFSTTSLAPDTADPNHSVPPVSRVITGTDDANKWANMKDLPPYPGHELHKLALAFDHEAEARRVASEVQEPVHTPSDAYLNEHVGVARAAKQSLPESSSSADEPP
eukprot:TRINITY_DN21242_c0_g1_i1.p1 TRINITY_DN21242_c0_g1~~TRINITY_DN21242_c0_g1_i1.p1  ORF type:complete len:861 (+),score=274.58 TRINITY_DN21242_c0_g1_i1:132-2585(+)